VHKTVTSAVVICEKNYCEIISGFYFTCNRGITLTSFRYELARKGLRSLQKMHSTL